MSESLPTPQQQQQQPAIPPLSASGPVLTTSPSSSDAVVPTTTDVTAIIASDTYVISAVTANDVSGDIAGVASVTCSAGEVSASSSDQPSLVSENIMTAAPTVIHDDQQQLQSLQQLLVQQQQEPPQQLQPAAAEASSQGMEMGETEEDERRADESRVELQHLHDERRVDESSVELQHLRDERRADENSAEERHLRQSDVDVLPSSRPQCTLSYYNYNKYSVSITVLSQTRSNNLCTD